MKNETITLRLEKDLREKLELIALEENCNLSKVIRMQLVKNTREKNNSDMNEMHLSFMFNPHFKIAISCMYFIATKNVTLINNQNLKVLQYSINEVLSFENLPDYLFSDFETLINLLKYCLTNNISLEQVNLDSYSSVFYSVFRYLFNISMQNITETL